MKKRFLDFSMIRGLGFNHVYRSVVADEDGAGSGGGTEEVVVVKMMEQQRNLMQRNS